MPERLTNRWYDILEELEKEMTVADENSEGTTMLVYVEIKMVDYLSIHYIKGEKNKLVVRIWNREYDMNRFSNGVYNLDRLAVTENIIALTPEHAARIDQLSASKPEIIPWSGIVLDGLSFRIINHRFDPPFYYSGVPNDNIDQQTLDLILLLRSIVRIAYPFGN